jgi:hypothetical protein
MAYLPEQSVWEPGIYQLEETDPVQGGPNGMDNVQAKQLVNRLLYLKGQVDDLGTGKQAADPTLSALAAVVVAADRIIYSTGPDAFSTTPLTTFIRTLLAADAAAAARATLGAAPLASPAFTGAPTGPTPAHGNNGSQLATTAFVQAGLAALVASSPAMLDTLNELATALGNDPNFATTMANTLAGKAPLASPALTGNPTAPTPAQFDADVSLATTAFVQRALGGYGQSYGYSTAGQTITPDRVNSTINLFGTCSSVILPLASACPVGSLIFINGVSLDCAVQCQGTDKIWANSTNNELTSITVKNGGSLMLVNKGVGQWFASGTPVLQYAAEYAKVFAASGYQRLPSGLILQWQSGLTGPSGEAAISWPVYFPTAVLAIVPSSYPQNGGIHVEAFNGNNAGVTMRTIGVANHALSPNTNYSVFAVGY